MAPAVFAHGYCTVFLSHSASHNSGSCNSLVRSVNCVLQDIPGRRRVTEKSFLLFFCLVEEVLNVRPITPVSAVSRDFEVLTLNHFFALLFAAIPSQCASLSPGENFDHKKRYVQEQSYEDIVWSHWLREDVSLLNKCAKCKRDQSDVVLKAGDLV